MHCAATTGRFLRPVLDIDSQTPLPSFSARKEDIARLHVEALNPRIPAGYQATTSETSETGGLRWRETNEVVMRKFTDAVQSGSLTNGDSSTSIAAHLDASEAQKTFGWKLQGYESQVLSVLSQHLELLESEKRQHV